jgi:hypothetical protein
MKRLLNTTIILISTLIIALPHPDQVARASDSDLSILHAAIATNTCQAVIDKALKTAEAACLKVGRNKACYGNNSVNIEPIASSLPKFSAVGDIVNIADIRTLTTVPLDETKGVWGISLLKLQANLPDSLPGQNVTFLVVGNTHIDNISGDMQTFYFSSGLGLPSCKEAPKDSIIVKSPQHIQVTFTANGTQITIASTILLRAEQGKQMSVTLIEGHATVKNSQGSQELKPGQQVTVPLGGIDGFTPTDGPSKPVMNPDATEPNINAIINAANGLDRSTNAQNGIRPTRLPQGNGGNANGSGSSNGNSNGSGNATGNGNGSGSSNGSSNGGGGNANGNGNGH